MDPLPESLQRWRERGRLLAVGGHRLFALEAGPAGAPALLVLHGFPTSSHDFHAALERLAEGHRVVLHDHLGFGLSDKPADASYSLLDQAQRALQVWAALGISEGHLVAHDYGTSVATELLALREEGRLPLRLRGLTLCNGSVHQELARLTPSQRLLRSPLGPLFARLGRERLFRAQVRRTFARPEAVADAELACAWAGLARAGGKARLPALSGYMAERYRYRERWIGALTRLDLPAHLLWGRRDPVAVPAIAEALAKEIPGARLTWLEGLGHYPMLEDPAGWAGALLAGLP